ncbi:MAG: N-6 DNA methylase [Anaerolineae bacterium]|nr:N-6 DNA methylase [Anaerolineae bacterium]
MVTELETPRQFLDTVYEELDYHNGALFDAAALPESTDATTTDMWINKGEWLSVAKQIEAEKVFFVGNDPVIVFHQVPDNEPERLRKIFQQTWCMARPQLLFIAFPGGLEVYSLNQPPVQHSEEWENVQTLIPTIRRVREVSKALQDYRREQIETRQAFRDKELGMLDQRADKRLILDLKEVRRRLLEVNTSVDPKYIHALIGRSIFIRYLEDRGILNHNYFYKVAQNTNLPNWNSRWLDILEEPETDLAPGFEERRYSRVLRNKAFTYALFKQLTEHFNGDMFPQDPEEEKVITQKHLDLLHRFLLGDPGSQQQKLFLWAYDFKIIPLELISSIYEEFYHKSGGDDTGTHYTPSVLVEYALSQVLTSTRLAQKPRVLDFACGSAIFLVQAYRRIVRYQESQLGRALTNQELRQILRDQIAGIEINEEAIRVAAFSLYLALLHYQEPKDILAQIAQANGEKPLPHIILDADHSQAQDATHYHILYRGNAFDLMKSEREFIKQKLDDSRNFKGRVEWERLYASEGILPFEPNSFDVIVGNPPWGYAEKSKSSHELYAAQEHALRWCDVFGWSVGDKELSQAFIARSLSLLKEDSECGLLVSSGVLLKRSRKSFNLRQRWLKTVIVQQVTSFIHVRHVFFSGAVSPFCFLQYRPGEYSSNHWVQYWSAKKTEIIAKTQAVILTLADVHRVRQLELAHNDLLWKVYWWGNHRDAALITALNGEHTLGELAEEKNWFSGTGFKGAIPSEANKPSDWLQGYRVLITENFSRYSPIDESSLIAAPNIVNRTRDPRLYEGWRLLVKRGITQAQETNGIIEARLEDRNYSYRNSIHGIQVENAENWERKLLIAILWSSLSRYYFFMTVSDWGPWCHEIYLEELRSMPVKYPDSNALQTYIVAIVDQLRNWNPERQSLFAPNGLSPDQIRQKQTALEHQLDEAIFDLYELNEPERDLILDLCETGLEFFYRKDKSLAVQRVEPMSQSVGIMADLPGTRGEEESLQGYLYAFLEMWNPQLETVGGEFNWRVIRAPNVPMLAVVFTTQYKGTNLADLRSSDDEQAWQDLLTELSETSQYPISERIYLDGMTRIVTDTNIVIIKRDERRLWTRSLAREDAEATLLQAMLRQEAVQK